MRAVRRIPLSIPDIGERERRRVLEALDTGWVSSAGPMIAEFERELARITGARFAVATANGTVAIHLALVAAGVGPGDSVLVPDLTFVGTVNPIRYCGARPVLTEVDERDGTMSPEAVREHARRDRTVRAVMPVHLYGAPADMTALRSIAAEHGLLLVEDAAEALGSTLDGRAAGTFGIVGCLSFNGNKIVTTGGGGALITDDAALASRARSLSTQSRSDDREYVHDAVGFNYRLTNIQAALGVAQLENFQERLERKRRFAALYRAELVGLPLRFLEPRDGSRSNYWLTAIVLDEPSARAPVLSGLDAAGIDARSFFVPVHRQAPYRDADRAGSLAVADALYERGINLPSSFTSDDDDIRYVCHVLRELLRSAR